MALSLAAAAVATGCCWLWLLRPPCCPAEPRGSGKAEREGVVAVPTVAWEGAAAAAAAAAAAVLELGLLHLL